MIASYLEKPWVNSASSQDVNVSFDIYVDYQDLIIQKNLEINRKKAQLILRIQDKLNLIPLYTSNIILTIFYYKILRCNRKGIGLRMRMNN